MNQPTTTLDTPIPDLRIRAFTPALQLFLLFALWATIFAASLHSPPLLDDADATHAQAAQAMLHTHDWVTLRVDGIRYLEKAPLPYWIAALSMAAFGENAFAVHLPLALTVLGLALMGYLWSRHAFGERAGFYTALFTLTAAGVFLFTRIFLPDALLGLFLACALYAFLRALATNPDTPGPDSRTRVSRKIHPAYLMWAALACAVLTKGLVALVFFFGTVVLFLVLNPSTRAWHRLRPLNGPLLFFAIAAPWHILAGLRNTGGANGHGFFWFYFVNEHFLRFLGKRLPRDYNKLPAYLYWTLHIVWLFPWSLFAPFALLFGWRKRREQQALRERSTTGIRLSRLELLAQKKDPAAPNFATSTVMLLGFFSALVLIFFSLSTNQEYYTLPVYLPLFMLLSAAMAAAEKQGFTPTEHRAFNIGLLLYCTLGTVIAIILALGLWSSRNLPFAPDIGTELAHRAVGQYTLSMSHFFDLTGASFAALRLPAALAAVAFAIGPAIAWLLWKRRNLHASLLAIAATSTVFLVAAHIAFVRFAPMLSSQNFAATIQTLEHNGSLPPSTALVLYSDQSYGSSLPFYLHRQALLVDGNGTSMLFGSTFPDAPPIFLTPDQLAAIWGTGSRKLLFVPQEKRDEALQLLGSRVTLIQETSGKLLLTDRPLDQSQ